MTWQKSTIFGRWENASKWGDVLLPVLCWKLIFLSMHLEPRPTKKDEEPLEVPKIDQVGLSSNYFSQLDLSPMDFLYRPKPYVICMLRMSIQSNVPIKLLPSILLRRKIRCLSWDRWDWTMNGPENVRWSAVAWTWSDQLSSISRGTASADE